MQNITMMSKNSIFLSLIFIFTGVLNLQAKSIVVLVNDEPITQFDINQRMKSAVRGSKKFGATIKANFKRNIQANFKRKMKSKRTQQRWRKMVENARPTSRAEVMALQKKFQQKLAKEVQKATIKQARASASRSLRPKARKAVIEELIAEKLKIKAAKNNNIVISEELIDDRVAKIASQNKSKSGKPMTKSQFLSVLRKQGMSEYQFKERMRASLSWAKLINRKFGYSVSISNRQIEKAMTGKISQSKSVRLVKVSLPVNSRVSEQNKARLYARASQLKSSARNCTEIRSNAKRLRGVKVSSLNSTKKLPGYIKSLLNKVPNGQLTNPIYRKRSIDLFANCSANIQRRAVDTGDMEKRRRVENQLRQKEILRLGQRYLKDLRQDAYIEYK